VAGGLEFQNQIGGPSELGIVLSEDGEEYLQPRR